MELQDYQKSCANLSFEDQQLLFSYRCEMNILKSNFKSKMNIYIEYCLKECKQELDNTHFTWWNIINKNNEIGFTYLLNGTLEEKIGTLNQIKFNELTRIKKLKKKLCDPVINNELIH